MKEPPVIFISYSHDSEKHKQWALKLAEDLRMASLKVTIDQNHLRLGDDITAFMENGLSNSHRVIVICSENYVAKADNNKGGVGYEKMIISSELVQNLGTRKFIPIIRNNQSAEKVPRCLGNRLYLDMDDDSQYELNLKTLIAELKEVPSDSVIDSSLQPSKPSPTPSTGDSKTSHPPSQNINIQGSGNTFVGNISSSGTIKIINK